LKSNPLRTYAYVMLKVTLLLLLMAVAQSCGVSAQYSMTGSTTTAQTISIADFYNNADLGPANMGQVLTNEIKNYFIRNSNLKVIGEEGQLQLEGEIMDFRITPISPTVSNDPSGLNNAAGSRLTITVRVTYVNTLDEKMSFKDKSFSFYKDFSNEENFSDVQETYTRQIFDRIINDIFNASVANW
jgi:hypothetical protein